MTSRSIRVGILVMIVSLGVVAGLAAGDITTGEQTIESQELSPGETTTVTVDVEQTTTGDPAVYQEFNSSFADIEIVTTDPSAAVVASTDSNDGVVAVWENTATATLQYEVTVPDNASDGEVYQLTGEVETENETTDITGDTQIVVSEDDSSGSSGSGSGSSSGSSGSGSSSPVPEPEAAIDIAPAPVTAGDETTFSGTGSIAEEQTIDAYEWVIDGTTLDGETVIRSFDEAGEYNVELTVTTDQGESNTTVSVVTVDEPDDSVPEPDEPADEEESGDESAADDASTVSETIDSVSILAVPVVLFVLFSAAVVVHRRRS